MELPSFGAVEDSRTELEEGRNKKFNEDAGPNVTQGMISLGQVLPQPFLSNCSATFFF